MEKDQTIIDLIDDLRGAMERYHLSLIDFWEADLCAIGLRNGLKMIYISTCPYLDQPVVQYNIDLELLDEERLSNVNVVKSVAGLSKAGLIEEINAFFAADEQAAYPGFNS